VKLVTQSIAEVNGHSFTSMYFTLQCPMKHREGGQPIALPTKKNETISNAYAYYELLNSTEQYTGTKEPVRPKRLQSDRKSCQCN